MLLNSTANVYTVLNISFYFRHNLADTFTGERKYRVSEGGGDRTQCGRNNNKKILKKPEPIFIPFTISCPFLRFCSCFS